MKWIYEITYPNAKRSVKVEGKILALAIMKYTDGAILHAYPIED